MRSRSVSADQHRDFCVPYIEERQLIPLPSPFCLSAIILVCIGLVYCAAGMACNDDREKARDLKAGGTGASASSAGPPTEQSMVPKNNNNAAPRKAQWPEMAPEDEFDNGGAL
jgi:hypothetical protein